MSMLLLLSEVSLGRRRKRGRGEKVKKNTPHATPLPVLRLLEYNRPPYQEYIR